MTDCVQRLAPVSLHCCRPPSHCRIHKTHMPFCLGGTCHVLLLRCEESGPGPWWVCAFLLWPSAVRSWRLTQIDASQVPTNRFVRHLHSASIVKSHNLLNRMIATDTAEKDTPLPCQAMRGVDLSSIDHKVASSDPDKLWLPAYWAFESRGYADTFGRP